MTDRSQYTNQTPPITQHDIACRAIELKNPILPMGVDNKRPFGGLKWSDKRVWIHTLDDLRRFYIQTKDRWAPDHCPGIICRYAISADEIVVIDVDFKKDQNKVPIGHPQLGPIKQEWLDQAGHRQKTASTYQGQHTYHHVFKAHKRCYQLPKTRLKGTTVDVIHGSKRLIILYELLPPKEVWDKLPLMPEDLFRCLIEIGRERNLNLSKGNEGVGAWKKPLGERNAELIKPLYDGFDDDTYLPILRSFFMAGLSDQPFGQMTASYNSINNKHHNKFKELKQSILRRYYEKGQAFKRSS